MNALPPIELADLKTAFAPLADASDSPALARTFFNSAVRRSNLRGKNAAGLFLQSYEFPQGRRFPNEEIQFPVVTDRLNGDATSEDAAVQELARIILSRAGLPIIDSEQERILAGFIRRKLPSGAAPVLFECIPGLFFRNKRAYLVGRIRLADYYSPPCAIPFICEAGAVRVDAALIGETSVRRLFDFTRSTLIAENPNLEATVQFLSELLPQKPEAQLFINLGLEKHGKTLLLQRLYWTLAERNSNFEIAPGARGMVMAVFSLEGLDFVLKIIRDEFDPPKSSSRSEVAEKYRLVQSTDRVGRLADAQLVRNLELPRRRFSAEAIDYLRNKCGASLREESGIIIISELYLERRMRPLNLVLAEADAEYAVRLIDEYGCALRDLARANIFPGDLLIKNFGVTPENRVVLYDYDEIALATEMNFRRIPAAPDYLAEVAEEPWYSVGHNDVFPEEWPAYLFPPGPHRDVLLKAHGDLFTAEFWQGVQRIHQSGEIVDLAPYESEVFP